MTSWTKLSAELTALLCLRQSPIGISFLAKPPSGVPQFRGEVPSSCSFWRIAASRPAGASAFYTVPADHYNCPVGSHTHRVALPPEREHELTDVLGFMSEIGYVKMSEVPEIPQWPEPPQAIVYSHLADAPTDPQVVLFFVDATAAMLLGEAARAAGTSSTLTAMPRPTCMALPAAAKLGATLSLGCIGNRVYTELDDGQLYAVVRGSDLEAVAAALLRIKQANERLRAYHAERKPSLTRL